MVYPLLYIVSSLGYGCLSDRTRTSVSNINFTSKFSNTRCSN